MALNADSGRGGFSLGELYYTLRCNELLRGALERARSGRLEVTWRADLMVDGADESPVIGDAKRLAIQEISEMVPADWEPGNAANWRAALDAWYAASRIVVGAAFTGSLERQIELVRVTNRLLPHSVCQLVPEDLDDADRNDFMWGVIAGSDQLRADGAFRTILSNYVIQRDWLTASYLAGLAAGGTPGPDWRLWLRERAGEWGGPEMAVRRVSIETNSRSHLFDKPLPAYWCGQ